jgi:short subunit fatty acids transporter
MTTIETIFAWFMAVIVLLFFIAFIIDIVSIIAKKEDEIKEVKK